MFKLIIIDDEYETRHGLTTLISWSSLDIEVIACCADGKSGLEKIKQLSPDIIISDIRMPGLNGIEMISEIREILPHIQIIFISGYPDKEYLKSAISLRAISFVEKPIDLDEIMEAARAACAESAKIVKQTQMQCNAQNIIKNNLENYKNQIAIDLIKANDDNHAMLFKIFPNIDFQNNILVTCLLKLSPNLQLSHEEINSRIKGCIYNITKTFVMGEITDRIFIIHFFNISKQSSTVFKSYIQQIFEKVRNELSYIKIFLAVGNMVNCSDELVQSYKNANQVLKGLFFLGYDHALCYNEKLFCNTYFNAWSDSIKQNFSKSLKYNNPEQTFLILSDIKNCIIKNLLCFQPIMIQKIYFECINIINTISSDRNILSSSDYDYIETWSTISEIETFQELDEFCRKKLITYFNYCDLIENHTSIVLLIKSYIEDHFFDFDLSIQKIADQLHFTPAYLCQTFKADTNITINSYITTIRMEKAKQSLKDKNIKLNDIAKSVGYLDSNYFSRVFKKYSGITASKYREKYLL